MKVLVIDDNQTHLKSAHQTLTEHDLTVCDNHDEALELLQIPYDEEEKERLLTEAKAQEMTHEQWNQAYEHILKETRKPYWDVVLSDLLMPAGRNAQGNDGAKYIGQEMPIGWSLALTAAKHGAKYVAVVTDMNHHHHPASAMLDTLNRHIFTIDGARALFTNSVNLVGIAGTEDTCPTCSGTKKSQYGSECWNCKGTGIACRKNGKNWGEIFTQLITGEFPR